MPQLSGLDATFLYFETAQMSMHVGAMHVFELRLNPLVLAVIADRLAQDPQHWQPFDVGGVRGVRGVRRFFFRLAPQAPHPSRRAAAQRGPQHEVARQRRRDRGR